jgi:hypothetical protein
MNTKEITRLEIIDKKEGRVFVTYDANPQEKMMAEAMIKTGYEHSFQDNGKTLKIFK